MMNTDIGEYADKLKSGNYCIDELLDNYLLEVDIRDPENQKSDDERFLILKETLSRIGMTSYKTKTLYQTCHIFHKRGFYYIVHFKELFALDGRSSTLSESDIQRRNFVAKLLVEWNLCEPVDWAPEELDISDAVSSIKMIPFRDKRNWHMQSKHPLGKT